MKIGLLIHGSLERLTGGFFYDRMLVEHLRRRGHAVEVVALPMRSYARGLLDNLSRRLFDELRNAGFDLLLQDELAHPSCLRLNRRLRRRGAPPIVAIVHLLRTSQPWPAWQRPLYRAVERRYLASVDGLILVNSMLRARIARLAGVEPPAVVAPPAGDHSAAGAILPDAIRTRARAPGPLRVLFVGNLSPLKNLDLVLDALAFLAGGWHLEVIGSLDADPAYAAAVRRRMARGGLERQITLAGALPPGEVADHLARGHVLAMPSAPESHGIAYDEAMSHGLPVVVNAASDAAARIEHGRHGFVVAPGDAAALAGHLRLLRDDREELARMGIAARRAYEAWPTWEESLERVHRFLLRLHAARSATISR